jgi:hypothetical protein
MGLLKKSLGCWILLISLLISIASYGQTPAPDVPNDKSKPKTASEQKKSSADLRGTEQMPLVIKMLNSPKDSEKSTSIPENHKKDPTSSWWDIPTEGWLVIFTAGLFFATLALWNATRHLVRGAERSSEMELRAYLFLEGNTPPITDTASGMEVRLLVKNVGKTPVYRMRHWINAAMQSSATTHFPTEPFVGNNTYIPPGVELHMSVTLQTPWRLAMLDLDDGSDVKLYVWGRIEYIDAFEKARFMDFRIVRGRFPNAILNYCTNGNDQN